MKRVDEGIQKGYIMKHYDAVVVGSGPNGLAAAIRLAQAKLSVLLIEGRDTLGGGMRSAELTLPGFVHDICSAIHPLGIASPFFNTLPLHEYGLQWIHPEAPLAHPFTDGTCVLLERSIEATATYLGQDGQAYQQLMGYFVSNYRALIEDILAPLHFPKHPLNMARFSLKGIQSVDRLVHRQFVQRNARALLAGLAAHSTLPLNRCLTAAFGLFLGFLGHAVGWPFPKGGTQRLTYALAAYFQSLGGDIMTGSRIEHFDQIPAAKAILLDVSPNQVLSIVSDRLPHHYAKALENYQYGPGVFKMDWALDRPIPWKSQECAKAGTVHLGGSFEDIAASEAMVWQGGVQSNHFIILAQPTLFDASRAPAGKHIAWAYCHVPNGSRLDLTDQIEAQIERYAPGFKGSILKRSTMTTEQMEQYNPNYVGGDINGGVEDIYQLFTRPAARLNPYTTPIKGLYLCSASTPPGGGVHGMCGYHAARTALKQCFS